MSCAPVSASKPTTRLNPTLRTPHRKLRRAARLREYRVSRLVPGAGTIPVSVTTMMSGDGTDTSRESDAPKRLSRPGSPTRTTNPISANERVSDTDGSSPPGRKNGKASRLDRRTPRAWRHVGEDRRSNLPGPVPADRSALDLAPKRKGSAEELVIDR